jgi:hypothetical protein
MSAVISLGADMDSIKSAEQALFFLVDRLASIEVR